MKKHKATASVTLYPAARVGLSPEQYLARAHNLELVADEDDVKICRVAKPVQFKRGEEFFADELPKTMATLVEPTDGGESGEESDKPVSKMNKSELQEYLTEKEVEFPSDADKKALLELAKKAEEQDEGGEGNE